MKCYKSVDGTNREYNFPTVVSVVGFYIKPIIIYETDRPADLYIQQLFLKVAGNVDITFVVPRHCQKMHLYYKKLLTYFT